MFEIIYMTYFYTNNNYIKKIVHYLTNICLYDNTYMQINAYNLLDCIYCVTLCV